MKQFYFLMIVFLFAASLAQAQNSRYTVRFKYKTSAGYSLSEPSAFLSQKAIERRKKEKIKIDSTDLPINAAYLDTIRTIPGVTILNTSKWFNQILVETSDPDAIGTINSLPFVFHTKPVAVLGKSAENMAELNDCGTAQPPASPTRATAN
jgi:hypothetical protein